MIGEFGAFEYPLAEHYRFEQELGRGAMGTVYRAHDLRLGRPVAIKMLHPMLTNELGAARFQSEIRIAASLHHPNIVGLHDSGEVDGRLYYVMDYLGGETLRARLRKEKQLAVDEALKIVDDVAAALQYAHDHGVVHRDVKPENILLVDGRACVVDFGLARVLGDVNADRLTASGLSVGTPHYLSPEQASAERDVGPRADQYALACVLFEMLVGEPPFTGPTATSIAMRHISEAPPALSARRRTTTPSVDAAVKRALEKVPADRFASVRDFAIANRSNGTPSSYEALPAPSSSRPGRRILVVVGALTLVILLGVAAIREQSSAASALDDGWRLVTGRPLDSMTYAVLVVAENGTEVRTEVVSARLRAVMSRWADISVRADEAGGAPRAAEGLRPGDGASLARKLGAGRYLIGSVSAASADSIRLRVQLFDTRDGHPKRDEVVTLSRDLLGADRQLAHVVYATLFAGDEAREHEESAVGTRSAAAFNAYLRGQSNLHAWNLSGADSAFTGALRLDPGFPHASLGLALARVWARDEVPELASLAARAIKQTAELTPAEQMMARALMSLAEHRYPAACQLFGALAERDSLDTDALLGLSECNRRDRTVVAARESPTGYAFRSSFNTAQRALGRALDALPQIHPCCSARAFEMIRRVHAFVSFTRLRYGFAVKGSATYSAYPDLSNDTLYFVPHLNGSVLLTPPGGQVAAVQHERDELYAIAARRVALMPGNADALELLSEALELRGAIASIDSTKRARLLARDEHQRLRLAVREIWLRVKFALPGNLGQLRMAKLIADSVLANARPTTSADADLLSGLAAMSGESSKAAKLAEQSAEVSDAPVPVPLELLGTARALLAYAAVGSPVDSIRALDARLATSIANGVAVSQQAVVREMYLVRAAGLAYPAFQSPSFAILDTATDNLLAAEAAHRRSDGRRVKVELAALQRTHAGLRASDLTPDRLFPEAWLLAAVGDSARALNAIASQLDAIRNVPVSSLCELTTSGSLLQSMVLRARLAVGLGDREVGLRWARAARALSSDGTAAAGMADALIEGRAR